MAEQRRPPRPARAGGPSGSAAPERPADQARLVAYDLLRDVGEHDSYANLVLPKLLSSRHLDARDSAFATELGYGTLRAVGTLDVILAACVDRDLDDPDVGVLDLLRLGAYQILRTRVPVHAAVGSTVDLARGTRNGRASGFINAVLRRVTRQDWSQWCAELSRGASPLEQLALRSAHPTWIAEAFADALGGNLDEVEAALMADDARPQTHLVAWPGQVERAELRAESGGVDGPYSPFAVRMSGGDPAGVVAIRARRAGVQDEGSQLCAIAVTRPEVSGQDRQWLDVCAGPGGKTALLAALGSLRDATVTANELHPHRAELIAKATLAWPVEIVVGDAREQSAASLGGPSAGFDRVLLDAPCSGLGALRRRPEARWRREASDIAELTALQGQLVDAALADTAIGGVLTYVTCSPHPAETAGVIRSAAERHGDAIEVLDARRSFSGVDSLGEGPFVQLWPHRHGTDAMFCAQLRRRS